MERKLIFWTPHGSHLYGLSHQGSDRDIYEVYEGDGTALNHRMSGDLDVVRGDITAFLYRAFSGSHQSVEALFSHQKQFAPGMEEKWTPFLAGIRIQGPEALEKYRRTIHKFCYGDFKRRRHALRLKSNYYGLKKCGRFNPTPPKWEARLITELAHEMEGDDLWNYLEEDIL